VRDAEFVDCENNVSREGAISKNLRFATTWKFDTIRQVASLRDI